MTFTHYFKRHFKFKSSALVKIILFWNSKNVLKKVKFLLIFALLISLHSIVSIFKIRGLNMYLLKKKDEDLMFSSYQNKKDIVCFSPFYQRWGSQENSFFFYWILLHNSRSYVVGSFLLVQCQIGWAFKNSPYKCTTFWFDNKCN